MQLLAGERDPRALHTLSVPCSSGLSMQHAHALGHCGSREPFQSPVHCYVLIVSAVSLSLRAFSPLFIGSLTVTQQGTFEIIRSLTLSVPCSSGLSLLPSPTYDTYDSIYSFQSPVHRVSHCYMRCRACEESVLSYFQSPVHRVSHCYKSLPN